MYLPRQDGATPLLSAANRGHLAVVEELLAAGADVNVTSVVRACM